MSLGPQYGAATPQRPGLTSPLFPHLYRFLPTHRKLCRGYDSLTQFCRQKMGRLNRMSPTCRPNIVNMSATDTNVCRLGGVAYRHKSRHCQPRWEHHDQNSKSRVASRGGATRSSFFFGLLPINIVGNSSTAIHCYCGYFFSDIHVNNYCLIRPYHWDLTCWAIMIHCGS